MLLRIFCDEPIQSCRKKIIHVTVNNYYNNKHNILNDKVRKDTVKALQVGNGPKIEYVCV